MSAIRDKLVTLDVSGMTCAACSARLERVLAKTPGVLSASVSLPLERADIEIAAGVPEAVLVEAVASAGFDAVVRGSGAEERRRQRDARTAARQKRRKQTLQLAVLAGCLALPFLVDMVRMMASGDHTPAIRPDIQAVLATVAQLVCGARFYRGAFLALRGGAANMDVLVAVGTTAAYGLSLFNLLADRLHHGGGLYFEAGVTVLAFLLIGKVLEGEARNGASATLEALAASAPRTAVRIVGGLEADVDSAMLRPGDIVAVRPGGQVPADGHIIEGKAAFDEALMTGESLPVARGPGDAVIAGSIASGGRVLIEVSATGEDTRLYRIARLVEDADIARSPTQQLADRMSAVFVPAVLMIAAVSGAWWWVSAGDGEQAMLIAVAVLVVACPCALGLATPIALVAGANAAARAGLIVADHSALEAAGRVKRIAFDKTGTLTRGQPAVAAMVAQQQTPTADAVALAAALATRSDHPLDRAMVLHASELGLALPGVTDFVAVPGRGVTGQVEGRRLRLGNAAMLRETDQLPAGLDAMLAMPELAASGSIALLADEHEVLAGIGFSDAPRAEAGEALGRLAALGVDVTVLSGDRAEAVAAFAGAFGITDAYAGLTPEAKIAKVEALRRAGEVVAVVGDGINDAPALSAADLGIAMGSGTEAAKAAAAVTLARPDLRLVPALIEAGRATRSTILQNLLFAFVFNGIGIPMAAMGRLTPAVAGAAMALSSVSVVVNAWRLARRRFAPRPA